MDPVTHGLVGASVSSSFAEKDKLRLAALLGAAGAMLPDLDVMIGTASDPLLTLEYHRQFTHSFFFIPVGALIVAGLLWWPIKKYISFKETYLYSMLGMATAGLVDVFTSYGVQLFWPFTTARFSWNLVSVFDPLLSLGVITGLGVSLYRKKKEWAVGGIGWVVIYLLFALTQQQKAEIAARQLAVNRNHLVKELVVKPTIGNQLVWSTRYVSGGRIYADGIRLVPFAEPEIYQGSSTRLVPWQQQFQEFQGSTLYRDIQRFSDLSNGMLVQHPEYDHVIGDGRYSMLPTTIKPLWGIRVDTTRPSRHVEFETFRDASPEVRQAFLNMLTGTDL